MTRNIITLTTDFGIADEFVGVMKGVILSVNPSASIVDVSHAVPPGDIETAALLMENVYPYYPDGSIHVMVIDPGVGTKRDILVLELNHQLFIGPDNGLFTLLFHAPLSKRLFRVTNTSLFLPTISSTFHGRDIFAPLAGHLSKGIPPEKAGEIVDIDNAVFIKMEKPFENPYGALIGRIVSIDRFGNLTTNIQEKDIKTIIGENSIQNISVLIHDHKKIRIRKTYGNVARYEATALLNSRNRLEIAVNGGNASEVLGLSKGDVVKIICA